MPELINLDGLCEAHKYNDDSNYKVLFEEIFSLCVNEDFLKTIDTARKQIEVRFKTNLPVKDWKDFYNLRLEIYKSDNWPWYQELLEKIRGSHRLFGINYEYNPLEKKIFREKVSTSFDLLNDMYQGKKSELEIDKLAIEDATLDSLQSDFSTLESILFYNDPMEGLFGREFPSTQRGGELRFEKNQIGQWVINGTFFVNSTKTEIKGIVDRDFGKIEKQIKEMFPVQTKKADPVKDLTVKYKIFQLFKAGKTKESIANSLGKMATPYSVEKEMARLVNSSKRFDLID